MYNYRVVPAIFGSQLEALLEIVKQMLLQALISQHVSVSEAAFTTTSSFIISIEVPGVRQRLIDLLPHMITVRLFVIRSI